MANLRRLEHDQAGCVIGGGAEQTEESFRSPLEPLSGMDDD